MKKILLFGAVMLLFVACSPKVSTTITQAQPTLDYKDNVRVIGLDEPMPDSCCYIGEIRITDSGFTTKCSYNIVIEKAIAEARKAGGNAIKITKHVSPSLWSSCHQINAQILQISDEQPNELIVPSEPQIDADYALLRVYRYGGAGSLISYDLHLGDNVLCRILNNYKNEIKLTDLGRNSLWAKTESKSEIPINVEPGKIYYLRCSVDMGIMVGRPSIELVDWQTGQNEYESFKAKHQ
nr:hypothetical protein [uncultured Carboxylicivirga sp.]